MRVEGFDGGRVSLVVGDVVTVDWSVLPLPTMIFTSPPYWGKRKYPIGDSWFGGVRDCPHVKLVSAPPPRNRNVGDAPNEDKSKRRKYDAKDSAFCAECGAWRGQLGHEPTPQLFAEHLADIFAGLPLAKDGTVWVNIGDSFIAQPAGNGKSGLTTKRGKAGNSVNGVFAAADAGGNKSRTYRGNDWRTTGLRPKCKAAVPERFVLAMIDRGFIFRNTIIWHKANCLPHSAEDRQNENFEFIYMFAKSPRYKYDKYAIKVPLAESSIERLKYPVSHDYKGTRSSIPGVEKRGKRMHVPKLPKGEAAKRHEKYPPGGELHSKTGIHSAAARSGEKQVGRDYGPLNAVWTLPTSRHSSQVGEHIAPMPEELPRRAVLLGTDENDVVLDPFAGSGTTAAVAYLLGRRAIAVDVDERMPKFFAERVGDIFRDGGSRLG